MPSILFVCDRCRRRWTKEKRCACVRMRVYVCCVRVHERDGGEKEFHVDCKFSTHSLHDFVFFRSFGSFSFRVFQLKPARVCMCEREIERMVLVSMSSVSSSLEYFCCICRFGLSSDFSRRTIYTHTYTDTSYLFDYTERQHLRFGRIHNEKVNSSSASQFVESIVAQRTYPLSSL